MTIAARQLRTMSMQGMSRSDIIEALATMPDADLRRIIVHKSCALIEECIKDPTLAMSIIAARNYFSKRGENNDRNEGAG